jgi:hypothetical protein
VSAPRQLRRFTVHADGTVFGPSGQKLSQFSVKGYLRVTRFDAGKYIAEPVHRLVCEAFHGPAPEDRPFARHINGIPTDNRADNLAWSDQAENEADKAQHGTALIGARHHQAKLTDADVYLIRSMAGSSAEVAPLFDIAPATVRAIRSRKTWRHLA